MRYDEVPEELRQLNQWVVTGVDKLPLNPRTLSNASVTDPGTWGSFEEAAAHQDKFIGFVFTENDPYVGIDLDAPQNPEQETRHRAILQHCHTYTEVSMSGTGVHLIGRGQLPGRGMRRDKVEVYDRERYFIVTGRRLNGTSVEDISETLGHLVREMQPPASIPVSMHDAPQQVSDGRLYERCAAASNGDKFAALAAGHWEGSYESQSEADYALMNILAFHSPNNEQVRRLFRLTKLGERDKAMRDDYLDAMLGRIRAEQNPPVDLSALRNNLTPKQDAPLVDSSIPYPDGLIGELAEYIYSSAIRPVREVALAGALGLVAGMAGRSYNISDTGLNLYIMLVAGTGIGKEGAAQGVSRIIRAAMPQLPAISEFVGPTEYASGQALIRELSENPCILSIMSEFGHTMQKINRRDATGADVLWRKVLLDVFNKSGHNDSLGRMVYSDAGKNTPNVKSPCMTLLTESAPESLYEELDESAIAMGLIPRFLLIECPDHRPPPNDNAWAVPGAPLVARVAALAQTAMSMQANAKVMHIKSDGPATRLLSEFNDEVDQRINKGKGNETLRQIWNRTHMKALRLAALAAVGCNKDAPVVTADQATWAIEFARKDSTLMTRRFAAGTGTGDNVQLARLRNVITNVLSNSRQTTRVKAGVVTHREITQRALPLSVFKKDRMGAKMAVARALETLCDGGELVELTRQQSSEHFNTRARCFAVTEEFETEDQQ